ncbi:hypothetical protein AOB46_11175 [Chryseobacterium indologenes]|uniref:Uncharacterized protein n=1 Tax=Chryseobacterium indologenes TaxID=253 RepID=A0A0N0IWC5_CHRID|nr:hypothetical protein AOB46_11175 [Chryseobacterium indologenes]
MNIVLNRIMAPGLILISLVTANAQKNMEITASLIIDDRVVVSRRENVRYIMLIIKMMWSFNRRFQ